MDILIIGRSRNTVDTATALVRAHGYTAHGVIADADAIAALDTGEFGALLIGAGVQRGSRDLLAQQAQRHGTTVLTSRRNGRDIETFLREDVFPALSGRS